LELVGVDYNIVFVSSAAFYGGIGGALVIHLTSVIKIPIRILKSYDFTIQHYENDSNLN
jgi:hypothetical protein